MSTSYDNLGHAGSFGDAHATPPDYLAHKDEPLDEYLTLLARDPEVNHPENQRNLFDDSPIEDRRWAMIARRFLQHTKRRYC